MSDPDDTLDRLYTAFTTRAGGDLQLLADAHQALLRLARTEADIAERYDRLAADTAHRTRQATSAAVDRALADYELRRTGELQRLRRRLARAEAALADHHRFRGRVLALVEHARRIREQTGRERDSWLLRGIAAAAQQERTAA